VLVGPLTKKGARKLHPSVRAEMIRRSNVYVSLCQASEWGMRGLQGSFPRFKKRLPLDSSKRELRLVMAADTNSYSSFISYLFLRIPTLRIFRLLATQLRRERRDERNGAARLVCTNTQNH
jgi:hypothetical protein